MDIKYIFTYAGLKARIIYKQFTITFGIPLDSNSIKVHFISKYFGIIILYSRRKKTETIWFFMFIK